VRGTGFLLYKETSVSVPIELYNTSTTVTDVEISVSGPLRNYVNLVSNDRLWTGNGFTSISSSEIKTFFVTLNDVPVDLYGMHQIKISVTYSAGSTSHLIWVAVLPIKVTEQGREPPSKATVGISRVVKKMTYGNLTLPVEVILQVW
jgi:hypothetical protein